MKNFLLMHCPSMQPLAEEIKSHVMCKDHCEIVPIQWDHFSDGFPNIFIQNAVKLPGKRVVLLLSLYKKEEIFEQVSILYALPRHSIRSLTVILSYFPPGTMERVDLSGQVATAKTLCRMLSCTPPTSRGPPQVVIYDIHALQEQFYFADSILPQLQTAMPLIVKIMEKIDHEDAPLSVAFPDEGSFKRFNKLLPNEIPTITCMKIRQGNKRKISIMEGDVPGRHIMIIDDLVQSGGTLMNCKNLLLELGAAKVSCFVTHAVFPNSSWRKFVDEPAGTRFEKFYVTNSCPEVTSELENLAPFEVISLGSSICEFLTEYL